MQLEEILVLPDRNTFAAVVPLKCRHFQCVCVQCDGICVGMFNANATVLRVLLAKKFLSIEHFGIF
jgi:hypothetical protein